LFRLLRWLVPVFGLLLLFPAVVLAADPAHNPGVLVFPKAQIWTLIVGALVPLVTYALNHAAPWVGEPVKAFVLAIAAAVAGALTTAIATNVFGWNTPTLQLVLSAVVAAFLAHKLIWLPSGVSTLLGGGRNRQAASAGPAGSDRSVTWGPGGG
jgi:hypothetical protein